MAQSGRTSQIFVGRQRELAALTAAIDDALEDRGQIVMLAGEPGIGKTRTAQKLALMPSRRAFWCDGALVTNSKALPHIGCGSNLSVPTSNGPIQSCLPRRWARGLPKSPRLSENSARSCPASSQLHLLSRNRPASDSLTQFPSFLETWLDPIRCCWCSTTLQDRRGQPDRSCQLR